MKKTKTMNPTRINERGFAARCVSAIVCFAFLLMGISAFGQTDNFAGATAISASLPATVTGDNTGATAETGEPFHSDWPNTAEIGRNSIWWTWTPATSGAVAIDTIGSQIDTGLGVWTGTAVNALSVVAVNEDGVDATGTPLQGGRSRVTFNAVAGTTYRIAVVGFESIGGPVTVNITSGGTPPPTGFTLSVSTTGDGTVTKSPDKTSYDTNEVVTLTAVPAGTNTFLGWGGDAAANGITNPITITMDANKTVTASFTGTVTPGTNTFTLTVIRTPGPGAGTVTRIPAKNRYDEGEVVTVIANPSGQRTFLGWTGTDQSSADRTNTVTMTSDKTITAAFSGPGTPGPGPGEFEAVAGVYNGLFFSTSLAPECSGNFVVNIRKNGRFTIRLISGTGRVAGAGRLESNGSAALTVGRGANAATVNLQTDLTGGSDVITGTVVRGDCTAELLGDRQIFNNRNPSPLQGVYTIVFPRNATNEVVLDTEGVPIATNTVIINEGHGFATLTINRAGRVLIRGSLADGARITQRTIISKDIHSDDGIVTGQVPLHVSLYRRAGHLIGWLEVTPTEVVGTVNWQRPEGGLVFPQGLDVDIQVVGSRFDRTQNPVITLTNPMLEIGGNSFVANGEVPLIIDLDEVRNNVLIGTGDNDNRVNLRIQRNGSVNGRFLSPVSGRITRLRGVVLQNINAVYGYYISRGARGYFQASDPVIIPE